jgi:arginyl-tRNA synthetase
MVLAKPAGQNPRARRRIVAELANDADVEQADVVGPGFVNLKLRDDFWRKLLVTMLEQGTDFGRQAVGAGKKINVEYVSASPTGPMHVGHGRGAVVGDTLANMLAFVGYDVTKEYYINDAGVQIDVLGKSVFLRYREALGDDIGEIPAGLYPGDYLVPVGQALAEEFGRSLLQMPEDEALAIVKDKTIAAMMNLIREDLALLNVRHEVFSRNGRCTDSAKAIKAGINADAGGSRLQGHAASTERPEAGGLGRS